MIIEGGDKGRDDLIIYVPMHEFESDESLKLWIDGDCYLQFCMSHIYSMIPIFYSVHHISSDSLIVIPSTSFPSPLHILPSTGMAQT